MKYEKQRLMDDFMDLGMEKINAEIYVNNIKYSGLMNGKFLMMEIAVADYKNGFFNEEQTISEIEKIFYRPKWGFSLPKRRKLIS